MIEAHDVINVSATSDFDVKLEQHRIKHHSVTSFTYVPFFFVGVLSFYLLQVC